MYVEAYLEIIGTTFREIRDTVGFSATEIGEKLGVSGGTVANWEAGRTRITTPDFIRLSLIYGEHPSDVMRRIEQQIMTEVDDAYYR